MNYACLKCGRGCEDFEEIVIDPATLEGLKQFSLGELVQDRAADGAFEPPDLDSPYHPGRKMLRKVGGKKDSGPCCFLREDKLCALHCAHGIESKPIPCRSFPYGFTETPGGTFVGLSFACTAVLQNHGPEVTGQREDVEATYRISPRRDAAEKPIMLAAGIPLTWEQYLLIEGDSLEILDNGQAGIDHRLIAQSAYLQMLSKFLLEARGAAGAGWDAHPEANAPVIEVFRRKMRGDDPERRWERFFQIAEKPSSSRLLRRVFLGYVLAFRNTYGVRLGRVGTALYVVGTYLRHAVGLGTVDTPRLRNPQAYRDVVKVAFDPRRPEHEALLQRFFSHCLFRKDLLVEEDMRFAHNMMLMHYGLIHWYAAAFAAAAGRAQVEGDDLMEAVRTVEQYFVYHSNFSRLFSEHPTLKGIMENMFQRPIYAFAMARHYS